MWLALLVHSLQFLEDLLGGSYAVLCFWRLGLVLRLVLWLVLLLFRVLGGLDVLLVVLFLISCGGLGSGVGDSSRGSQRERKFARGSGGCESRHEDVVTGAGEQIGEDLAGRRRTVLAKNTLRGGAGGKALDLHVSGFSDLAEYVGKAGIMGLDGEFSRCEADPCRLRGLIEHGRRNWFGFRLCRDRRRGLGWFGFVLWRGTRGLRSGRLVLNSPRRHGVRVGFCRRLDLSEGW